MRTEVVYSTSNEAQEALHQISEKLEKLDIKPSFLFLFLTAGTWKAYEDFNKLLESYYPDAKMLGCIVEGYIAEDEIWTRGVSILLAEFDGEVEVYWANEGSATETVERLGDEIGEGWDSILLMFPAFYFPGKLEFIKFFFNDKRYYHSFV
ncbi:MAG: FIST N-terminal domain-containing protein, partial [Archaeoglobaceae archaeon]